MINGAVFKPKYVVTRERSRIYTTKLSDETRAQTSMSMGACSQSNSDDVLSNCVYLPHYFCAASDMFLYDKLLAEMSESVNWTQHMKVETPGETFNYIVDKLAHDFNIKVMNTRLNYYRDNSDWKPFHHDSHIGDENYTIGASFGATRALAFTKHEKVADATYDSGNRISNSAKSFSFPQHNGDVFGFGGDVNDHWAHGVPRCKDNDDSVDANGTKKSQGRFSVIVWGYKQK